MATTKRTAGPTKPEERRVASLGKREQWTSRSSWGGRLANPDQTLKKHSNGRGISLYTLVLRQFASVHGYCQGWVDHILVNEPTIKPAKAVDPEQQEIADAASAKASRAWLRVRNRVIVTQKLLFGRFYGFARAEKVARFDEVVGEWIPDLYDVPQECWTFDDDGREFMTDAQHPRGVEVDPGKFVHFQWGSADTKYGEGALSATYLSLWKIQKLETWMLQRVEDNESVVIVHVPGTIVGNERTDLENAYADEYRKVILVPSNEMTVRTEFPTMNITTSGAAGRQEQDVIRMYERWIQTALLGAPQTGDKALGTGKLEDTRQEVWDDKTPIGRAALDYTLTEGWMQTYCDWNLADLPLELRPRFESDTLDIAEGMSGIQAQEARNVALDLVANRITTTVALELWGALGMPRARAQAMADSVMKERGGLEVVAATPSATPPPAAPAPTEDDDDAQAMADIDARLSAIESQAEGDEPRVQIPTETGKVLSLRTDTPVRTKRGNVAPDELVTGDELVTLKG